MKTLPLTLACASLLLLSGSPLHSQQNVAAPRTVSQTLQEMKARNQKMIEQQAASLQKLEELEKAAAQLRILARRT